MVHSSGRDAQPDQQDEADHRSGTVRWMYRLIAAASAVFILTILVMIAVTMSDPTVPANRAMGDWLDRYSTRILILEVFTIGLLVIFAFLIDRRESWKRYHRDYAAWEQRMQQASNEQGTHPESATSSGDAE